MHFLVLLITIYRHENNYKCFKFLFFMSSTVTYDNVNNMKDNKSNFINTFNINQTF